MHDKVVLITGGGKRVGAAICRRLHAAGAHLMLHYRASAGEARLLQAELNHPRELGRADPGRSPRRQQAAVARRADGADVRTPGRARQQRVVVLSDPIGEITPASWTDLIGTNLQAPLFLAQAAAPALHKTQGAIVNITDIHAERPLKSYVAYSVAKAGLVVSRARSRASSPRTCASTRSRPGRSCGPTTIVRRTVAPADHLATR